VPSLSLSAPKLVDRLRDKDVVVFHCALSQQRGPGAALKYVREKARQDEVAEQSKAGQAAVVADGGQQDERPDGVTTKKQRVLVLDRGFVGWQRAYGEDERLTEGYSKALWQDYMD
jgi:rhodanese-related sulfurtransferase